MISLVKDEYLDAFRYTLRMWKYLSILVLSLLSFISCENKNSKIIANNSHEDSQVIYGQDTRQDLESRQLPSPAAATGLMISRQDIKPLDKGRFNFRKFLLKQAYPLCDAERFQDQYLLGFCSGVLVGPKYFLTAGHCMRNQKQCDDTLMTFGFTADKSKRGQLLSSEIYACKNIIKRNDSPAKGGYDFALIELDRIVTQARPVKMAQENSLKVNDRVVSLSYPLGLPLKSDVGHILRLEPQLNYIEAAVDTFSGSSGSGLFNSSGELLGILSSGSEDLLEDDIKRVQTSSGCLSFNRCDSGTCRSERFFKASKL